MRTGQAMDRRLTYVDRQVAVCVQDIERCLAAA